jgi:tetraacyldisaccharide 4'-kinase
MLFAGRHPDITIAVDSNRVRGIKKLLKEKPLLKVILLDDAFQHRYVKPGLSILLTDYFRLYSSDYIMPTGHLREFRSGAKRADIIVVTKTPKVFSPLDKRFILNKLKPRPHQTVYFSYISYGKFKPLFDQPLTASPEPSKIMLFTGISNPIPFEEYLKRNCNELISMRFRDHHRYSCDDIRNIKEKFEALYSANKIIVTTEKDRMRLYDSSLKEILTGLPVYYVPIEIEFHKTSSSNEGMDFDTIITDYLKKSYS